MFEIKKFKYAPVFFSDRKKISDFDETVKNLPKNSSVIIREYDLKLNEREIFAKNILKSSSRKDLKILAGKDFTLARKIKADGIHFSDLDKLPLQFFKRKSFPRNFIFSISCHDFKSVLKFSKLNPDIIFISPIFSTSSHEGVKPIGVRNLSKIILAAKNSPKKIYALGGINSSNIKSVLRLKKLAGIGGIDIFKK